MYKRQRVGLRNGERPLLGFTVDLGHGREFKFDAHRRVMAVGTAWLARQMPAMYDFVVAHLQAAGDRRRLEHPERTLASYVFQEAEGVSREAKLWWAGVHGATCHSLQHDGVVLQLDGGWAPAAAAHALSQACSQALGYEQPVTEK